MNLPLLLQIRAGGGGLRNQSAKAFLTRLVIWNRMGMLTTGIEGVLLYQRRQTEPHTLGKTPPVRQGSRQLSATTAKPDRGLAMSSGIYQIMNQLDRKRYIGSTTNLGRRWREHLARLRHKYHPNPHLQRAFNKYGEDAFVFSVLAEVKPEALIEYEQNYLNTLLPEYNIAPTAGSKLGCRHSLETRRRMSSAHKGKHLAEATKRKISEAQRGERGNNYGKHPSKETRKKLSEAGKGRHLSAETRRKISEALRGRIVSKETRAKLSTAQKGKRHSEETKRKMSEAQQARWHKICEDPTNGQRRVESRE